MSPRATARHQEQPLTAHQHVIDVVELDAGVDLAKQLQPDRGEMQIAAEARPLQPGGILAALPPDRPADREERLAGAQPPGDRLIGLELRHRLAAIAGPRLLGGGFVL